MSGGYFTPQIVGHLTWIRCPRCAWPMVEGLCGQCGFEDRDYVDDAYDDDAGAGAVVSTRGKV